MDRNEAHKAAEVMLAYAGGKEVEWSHKDGDGSWIRVNDPGFNWFSNNYRIKPEPKYRPFKDAEECWQEMQKHQPFGWVKNKGGEERYNIVSIDTKYIYFNPTMSSTNYNIVFDEYVFADGSAFGVKEEGV